MPVRRRALLAVALTLGGALIAARPFAAPASAPPNAAEDSLLAWPTSSRVLAQLPDGEEKRRFITDCTGCHQMGMAQAYPGGRARTRDEWSAIVTRMVGFAGASTGFPVISAHRDAARTAEYLARHLTAPPAVAPRVTRDAPSPAIVEYRLPLPNDLAHDVAIDSAGRVVVTGMFSHAMHVLDTASGAFRQVAIPVERANPRAVEVDARGDWWVLLGNPRKVARYRPASGEWTTTDIGMYPHSIGLARDGKVWFNGHFTKDPELVGYAEPASGEVKTFAAPAHPTMASIPGGPIPYELRLAPDGTVWFSELQGNRIIAFTPATGAFRTLDMPETFSAPRRFDIDRAGALWIPAYASNALVRLDPATGRFESHALPTRDAIPYVARVDHRTGLVWVGASASDEVYAFDPRTRTFATHALPSRGAMVRHLVIDPRNGDVWLAYGASPGIPARIARLRPAAHAHAPAAPAVAAPRPAAPSMQPGADTAPGVTALRWSAGPALAAGRDHHVTFLTRGGGRDWLWVVGGNDYRRMFNDAWRAPIARDGSVGAWIAADSLPAPHGGHAVAQTERAVVLTGGQTTGLVRTADVFVARVQPDGTLGAWTPGPALPAPRYHHGSVAHGSWVYVTGGIEQSISTSTVWRARLGADGSLGAWEPLPDLPRPRSHHAALVHGGALYLVAGQDGNPAGRTEPLADIVRARIARDGTLGPWETVSTLPHAYATHAATVHDGRLYVFGGVEDNARFVDVIWRARLDRAGRPGPWERTAAPLPAPRAHVHHAPLLRGRVYSVAGSNRRVVSGDVAVGEFVR